MLLFFILFHFTGAYQNILNSFSVINNSTNIIGEYYVTDTTTLKEEYDFIVIGAGAGGCVITNRLTENPKWNVLLLEAGGEENFITDVPLISTTAGLFAYSWKYSPVCPDRITGYCEWQLGKIMGGSSTTNYMLHNRGSKTDFNEWGLDNPGWSYDDVLPYFIKSEKIGSDLEKDADVEIRGRDGYLSVEYPKYTTPLLQTFLESGKELGYEIKDHNGYHEIGFSRIQANLRNGRRCSASKAYIRPIKDRPNLYVAKNAWVTKILIDSSSKKAYGVQFVKNKTKYQIKVKKEVILSAGALNSPQLLMLSGIGSKAHLKELNLPCIQDLKVGYNFQNHPAFFGLIFLINKPISIDQTTLINPHNIFEYIKNNRGPYTVPGGIEAAAFINFENKSYPDAEVLLDSIGLNLDSGAFVRHILSIPEVFWEKVLAPVKNRPAFTLQPALMKTESRGRVMLRSTNPADTPLIFPNYFKEQQDIKNMIKTIKMVCFW